MNERIRELAEQAGSTHKQNLGVYQFYEHELEKFVELIVEESVQVMIPRDYHGEWLGGLIKEHFGIK